MSDTLTCTNMDHCYPQNAPDGKTAPGTHCYCGRRTWGIAPTDVVISKSARERRVSAGTRVRVLGELRTVKQKLRGEDCYRIDVAIGTRVLFERSELEVVK